MQQPRGDPEKLSYWLAANMPLHYTVKTQLLGMDNTSYRLRKLIDLLHNMKHLRCRKCLREVGCHLYQARLRAQRSSDGRIAMDSHWLVGFQVAHARDMLAMSEAGSGSVFVNAHGGARGPVMTPCPSNFDPLARTASWLLMHTTLPCRGQEVCLNWMCMCRLHPRAGDHQRGGECRAGGLPRDNALLVPGLRLDHRSLQQLLPAAGALASLYLDILAVPTPCMHCAATHADCELTSMVCLLQGWQFTAVCRGLQPASFWGLRSQTVKHGESDVDLDDAGSDGDDY